jgi:hypothetical protein
MYALLNSWDDVAQANVTPQNLNTAANKLLREIFEQKITLFTNTHLPKLEQAIKHWPQRNLKALSRENRFFSFS